MRRDSNDKQWQETKKVVRERDRGQCRLCRCLSIPEMIILKKNAKQFIETLDPAHYLPVSERPDICYDSNNVCLVNHYSHNNLDNFRDPIDGHNISAKEVNDWWIRILRTNRNQYNYLLENDLIKEI